MAPRPAPPRPVMPRPVRARPMMPIGGYYERPNYRPSVRVPLIVPIPYYPPVVPVTVPVQPLPAVRTNVQVNFPEVLGQLNYLMEQARGDQQMSTADIVSLSTAIDRAQSSDADGLLSALGGMSAQMIDMARQLGMAYLVQLSMLR